MYWLFQSCPVFFFIPPASITFSDFHKFSLLFDARHFYTVLQVTLQKKWYQEYRKACKHCTCNNHIPLSIIAAYHVSKINHNCSIFRFLIYNQRPQVIVPVPQEKSNTQWDNNWSWKRKYDCKKHSYLLAHQTTNATALTTNASFAFPSLPSVKLDSVVR